MMESTFKINKFDSFDDETQQEIQDFICGFTTDWEIDFFNYCDACGKESELIKVESEGGIIRICKDCNNAI